MYKSKESYQVNLHQCSKASGGFYEESDTVSEASAEEPGWRQVTRRERQAQRQAQGKAETYRDLIKLRQMFSPDPGWPRER